MQQDLPVLVIVMTFPGRLQVCHLVDDLDLVRDRRRDLISVRKEDQLQRIPSALHPVALDRHIDREQQLAFVTFHHFTGLRNEFIQAHKVDVRKLHSFYFFDRVQRQDVRRRCSDRLPVFSDVVVKRADPVRDQARPDVRAGVAVDRNERRKIETVLVRADHSDVLDRALHVCELDPVLIHRPQERISFTGTAA